MKISKITLSLILTLALVISTVAFIPMASVQASGAADATYNELNQPIKTWDMSTFAGVTSSAENVPGTGANRYVYTNASGMEIKAYRNADIKFEDEQLVFTKNANEVNGIGINLTDDTIFNARSGSVYTMEIPIRFLRMDNNPMYDKPWKCWNAMVVFAMFKDQFYSTQGVDTGYAKDVLLLKNDGKYDYDNGSSDQLSHNTVMNMYIVYTCNSDGTIKTEAWIKDNQILTKTVDKTMVDSTGKLTGIYLQSNNGANFPFKMYIDDIKLYAGDIKSTTKLQLTPSSEYSSVPETGTNTVEFTSSNASSNAKYSLVDEYAGVNITDAGLMTIDTNAAPGIVKVKVTDTSVSPYSTIYNFHIKPGIAYTEASVLKTWDMGSFEDVQATENTYDTFHKYKRLNYTNADGLVVEAIKDAEITFNDGKLVYTHNAENPSDLAIGITTNSQTLFNVTDGDTYTIAIPFKFTRGEGNTAPADNWFSSITLLSLCSNGFWTTGGENSKISNGIIETDGGYGLTGITAWNGRGILSNEKEATIYIEYMCGANKNMTANMYINDIAIGSSALSADGVTYSESKVTRLHMTIPKRVISGQNKFDYTLEIGDIKLYEGNVKALSSGMQRYAIEVENNTASPKTIVLYGASYEGNTLTAVDLESKDISAHDKETFTVNVAVTENDTKLAYFLWENGTLTPITGFKPVNRVK